MLIVFNPTAGRRWTYLLWQVLDVLALAGVRFTVMETQHPGHAEALARTAAAAGHSLSVAAGGTGSRRKGRARTRWAAGDVGIVPLGTATVLAQELRLSP